MPATPTLNVRFSIGSFNVDLLCYQWGYTDIVEYLERDHGTSGYGRRYRTKLGKTRKKLTLTFMKTDAVMDRLHQLTAVVARRCQPVVFYPDLDYIRTFILCDWPLEQSFNQTHDNRQEVTIELFESVA